MTIIVTPIDTFDDSGTETEADETTEALAPVVVELTYAGGLSFAVKGEEYLTLAPGLNTVPGALWEAYADHKGVERHRAEGSITVVPAEARGDG